MRCQHWQTIEFFECLLLAIIRKLIYDKETNGWIRQRYQTSDIKQYATELYSMFNALDQWISWLSVFTLHMVRHWKRWISWMAVQCSADSFATRMIRTFVNAKYCSNPSIKYLRIISLKRIFQKLSIE